MRVTVAISLLHAGVSLAAARCYNLAGTAPVDASFQPCDPDAEVSACCAVGKSQPDICMQGGLCYATMNTYNGYIYGNGCTDSTGQDDACPYACPAKAYGWKSYNVLQCSRGTWCCREASDTTNCCDNSTMVISGDATSYLGKFVNNIAPGSSSSSSSSSDANATTTIFATETATSTITATAAASANATSGPSVAVVGASVGAVLGVAFIAALSALLFLLSKLKTLKKEVQSLKQNDYGSASGAMASSQASYYVPPAHGPVITTHEADWNHQRHEMDSNSASK